MPLVHDIYESWDSTIKKKQISNTYNCQFDWTKINSFSFTDIYSLNFLKSRKIEVVVFMNSAHGSFITYTTLSLLKSTINYSSTERCYLFSSTLADPEQQCTPFYAYHCALVWPSTQCLLLWISFMFFKQERFFQNVPILKWYMIVYWYLH